MGLLPKSDDLIDLSDFKPFENRDNNSSPNLLHQTIRQKPPSQTKAYQTSITAKATKVRNILELARSYPGQTIFELSLGKFFIDASSVPKRLRERPLTQETWDSMYHGTLLRYTFVDRYVFIPCRGSLP